MRISQALIVLLAMCVFVVPARYAPGAAAQATPDDAAGREEPTAFQARFTELAASLPDWLEREDVTILYADLAWRADYIGVDYADSVDGLIDIRAGIGMAVPPAFMYAAYFPHLGFTSSQVTRTLTLDAISDKITLMQGDFDPATMNATLIENGYVEDELAGLPLFVFGGDDHVELSSEVGSLAITGKTQYLIILEDGLLGFTNKRAFAEQIVAAHLGEGPSLAQHADIQALIASSRSDLVSAQIWSVSSLGLEADAGEDMETDGKDGAVPPYQWALLGDSVGTGWSTGEERFESEPDAAGVIVLLLDDADQVETALTVVPTQFESMSSVITRAPYAELLTLKSAKPGASAGTVVFEFDIPVMGRLWQMWVGRDLQFIYPG